jgi:hypothetical protein
MQGPLAIRQRVASDVIIFIDGRRTELSFPPHGNAAGTKTLVSVAEGGGFEPPIGL